jgi:hypothetical protein
LLAGRITVVSQLQRETDAQILTNGKTELMRRQSQRHQLISQQTHVNPSESHTTPARAHVNPGDVPSIERRPQLNRQYSELAPLPTFSPSPTSSLTLTPTQEVDHYLAMQESKEHVFFKCEFDHRLPQDAVPEDDGTTARRITTLLQALLLQENEPSVPRNRNLAIHKLSQFARAAAISSVASDFFHWIYCLHSISSSPTLYEHSTHRIVTLFII